MRFLTAFLLICISLATADSQENSSNSWEFHTSGNIVYKRLNYTRGEPAVSESGSELSYSLDASVEYNSNDWVHSFEISLSGDWIVDKENMPSLDTSAWENSLGLGYSLIGNSLTLDAGTSISLTEEDGWNPDFFLWAEKYFARIDKQKFGAAFWGYESLEGTKSLALYGSWRRYVKYGWKGSVYAGGRFDADSVRSSDYWLKWVGPALKTSFSYRFKTDISVDARLNMFYGFAVGMPDDDLEKFNTSWGVNASWTPKYFGIFAGLDQFYKYYVFPTDYVFPYSKKSTYTLLKAGFKWNI